MPYLFRKTNLTSKRLILQFLTVFILTSVFLVLETQTSTGIEASGKIVIGGGHQKSEGKDFWDKAGVVSQFIASVVIVLVGAFITARIQRTQITTNKESADAQVKASRETADAQIEASNIRARAERRIQEGDLVRQFLEHLKSASDVERELAIVALHGSIPDKKYFDVVSVIARNDPKESVRSAAINMLKASDADNVRQTLGKIVNDRSRGEAERRLAEASAIESSLTVDIPRGTVVMAASSATEPAFEISELGGGFFTHFVAEALSDPELLKQGGGQIELNALFDSVMNRMSEYRLARGLSFGSTPNVTAQGITGAIPLVGEGLPYSKATVVAVGVGEFKSEERLLPLGFAETDARKILSAIGNSMHIPVEKELIVGQDATAENVAGAILEAVHTIDSTGIIFLYFVGHSFIDLSGDLKFACSDAEIDSGVGMLSMKQINRILRSTKASVRVVILDTSYSGAATDDFL